MTSPWLLCGAHSHTRTTERLRRSFPSRRSSDAARSRVDMRAVGSSIERSGYRLRRRASDAPPISFSKNSAARPCSPSSDSFNTIAGFPNPAAWRRRMSTAPTTASAPFCARSYLTNSTETEDAPSLYVEEAR